MRRLRLRRADLEWREVEGEVLALESDTSTYVAANASGAVLWSRLAEGTTRDELVAALTVAYGIDEAQAAADVDAFVAELDGRALLEP